ncbi:MAG: hypothetical protein K9L74_03175 [Candidatus Izimaplasma sp.]|nr:hypothetical protein [Candidatus Izimaplasma bacterium]
MEHLEASTFLIDKNENIKHTLLYSEGIGTTFLVITDQRLYLNKKSKDAWMKSRQELEVYNLELFKQGTILKRKSHRAIIPILLVFLISMFFIFFPQINTTLFLIQGFNISLDLAIGVGLLLIDLFVFIRHLRSGTSRIIIQFNEQKIEIPTSGKTDDEKLDVLSDLLR